jgi:hypothetical protein
MTLSPKHIEGFTVVKKYGCSVAFGVYGFICAILESYKLVYCIFIFPKTSLERV